MPGRHPGQHTVPFLPSRRVTSRPAAPTPHAAPGQGQGAETSRLALRRLFWHFRSSLRLLVTKTCKAIALSACARPCGLRTRRQRAAQCVQRRQGLQGRGVERWLGRHSATRIGIQRPEASHGGTVGTPRAPGRCWEALRAAERRANSATYSLNRG